MRSFKEFISEAKSYESQSKCISWKQSPLFFNSAFSEFRKINESWDQSSQNETSVYKRNHHGVEYSSNIHDDKDVIPKELTNEHKEAIHHYCTAHFNEQNGHSSSRNMNSYLRNCSGDASQSILGRHSIESVRNAIQKLSSAFSNKQNTNRKSIVAWNGVPKHVGEHLMKSGKGSEHHIPGFTSTSVTPGIAHSFASRYSDGNEDRHVVRYHVLPGAGLSAAHHSEYAEDEVILHHGAKIKYSHTESSHHNGDADNPPHMVHVHHVTVFPEHKPLSEYGKYNKPSFMKKFFGK